ncbi:phosphopantetheine-binding protein [Streptomyces longwoodensis]|uniref:phosphopantetheine-binding protein n=1 Tax=Streptomyces longwoodensis TaxID=68231 RepID=UPI0033FCDDB8
MSDVSEALRAEVRAAVGEILRVTLDPSEDDQPLSDRYEHYDSLAVIDSVAVVEQRTGVSIDLVEDDLRVTFASVTSIAGLVSRKRAAASVLESGF